MNIRQVKKAGLIGGVSWYTTAEMYRLINQRIYEMLGGLNSAEIFVASVNLNKITCAPSAEEKSNVLADAARSLEDAGADFIALGSNGLHQFAGSFMRGVSVPFFPITECVTRTILKRGFNTVGLLGVQETMSSGFYTGSLAAAGIRTIVPVEEDKAFIDRVLFEETGKGIVKEESARKFYEISEGLCDRGAQGIILGCTEIGMLMHQSETGIPLFDTMQLYSRAIADKCLGIYD